MHYSRGGLFWLFYHSRIKKVGERGPRHTCKSRVEFLKELGFQAPPRGTQEVCGDCFGILGFWKIDEDGSRDQTSGCGWMGWGRMAWAVCRYRAQGEASRGQGQGFSKGLGFWVCTVDVSKVTVLFSLYWLCYEWSCIIACLEIKKPQG